jgi:hypothetical protein
MTVFSLFRIKHGSITAQNAGTVKTFRDRYDAQLRDKKNTMYYNRNALPNTSF